MYASIKILCVQNQELLIVGFLIVFSGLKLHRPIILVANKHQYRAYHGLPAGGKTTLLCGYRHLY